MLNAASCVLLRTVLDMQLYPYNISQICAVPKKGVGTLVSTQDVRFISNMGLINVADRDGRDTSFNAMVEETRAKARRTGKPDENDGAGTAVPIHLRR